MKVKITLFFVVSIVSLVKIDAVVTNEDIRLAILQIVNVVRNVEDKLERHEFREKVLGEQLKKGLINIDKRIKMLDPLKGTVSRIDERLAAVETILMQRDREEKERQVQQQKTYEAILDLQKNLPLVINQLNQDLSQKILSTIPPAEISEPMMTKNDFTKIEQEVITKIDKVTSTVNNVGQELMKIREDNIQNIKDITNRSSENLDKVKRQLDNSEILLAKYENKLAEYNNKIPEIIPRNFKEDDSWKENFLKALENQKSQVKEILDDIKVVQEEVNKLPSKGDIQVVQNSTLHKLEEIKSKMPQNPVKSLENLENSLTGIKLESAKNQEMVNSSFNVLTDITSHLTESFAKNYEDIRNEIQKLSKMEKVVMQTADSILDTKRRVEYGTLQIISEVTKQMKEGSTNIGQGIDSRFDNFEQSILDEEYGALHNLTSKIQEEIGRVWRQIGIMHQQMSANSDTLNKLQNQTDVYVNGSLNVMDSMTGKVSQITGRMTEVDENLNFLLGKLSLLSQEFNRIKSGLGSTLDEIRSTFQNVQTKIKDKGPGPHKIASYEVIA